VLADPACGTSVRSLSVAEARLRSGAELDATDRDSRDHDTGPLSCASGDGGLPANCVQIATGLSRTLYDVLRITTWAVLIVGLLMVAVGLIGYARWDRNAR
jgi:hypothetical protein